MGKLSYCCRKKGETMIKGSSSGEVSPVKKINSPLIESKRDSWRMYFMSSFLEKYLIARRYYRVYICKV